jgi:hypothetical protein
VLHYIGCGGSLGAVDNVEGSPGAFLQGFEALRLNRGMMHEYILASVLFNKQKNYPVPSGRLT